MKRIEIDSKTQSEIIKMYTEDKKGYKTIQKELNLPYSTIVVLRFLKENNLMDKNRVSRKYKFDENFFETIDTEEKAYWLGFIYADGAVFKRTLSIRLSTKDIHHLEKFKKILNTDSPIKSGIQMSFGVEKEYCLLAIHSSKLVKDLINKGCVYNKSKILKFPKEEQVPKHLIKHFIRGYFDGDGSIHLNKKSNQYIINFCGTFDFLTSLKEELAVKSKICVDKRNGHHSLSFGGNLNVLEKMRELYDFCTVSLERKYDKYLNLKNIYTDEMIDERSKYSSRFRE